MSQVKAFLPTAREGVSLAKIRAWKTRMAILPFLLLPLLASRWLMEINPIVGWMVIGIAMAALLGSVVYVSFFLRCPRCSGWIGVGSSKCLSCGLVTAEQVT